jgi:hypothetical protein
MSFCSAARPHQRRAPALPARPAESVDRVDRSSWPFAVVQCGGDPYSVVTGVRGGHLGERNTRRPSRVVSACATTLLIALPGCAGLGGFDRVPAANPPQEQPSPLTAEWSPVASGESLGLRWALESRRGDAEKVVCVRVRLDPPPRGLPSAENCGTVGEGYDFASVILQQVTGDNSGIVLGVTDPSVTEVRVAVKNGDMVRVQVDRQAFIAVVPDPFDVTSYSVFRRGDRLATYPCPDGGC